MAKIAKKIKAGARKKVVLKKVSGPSSSTPKLYAIKKDDEALVKEGNDAGALYWLGVAPSSGKAVRSAFDFINVANSGLKKFSLDKLAGFIGISRKNLAEKIFDVSVKTLERKDDHDLLDKRISSHAVELARVVQHAYEVFENKDKVKLWLNRENKSLNNLKPVDLLDTLSGINMVNDILSRIEEGVYS
jgi:putative toxin-antitoxin system antitoxin component (TIGR02293 family)